MTEILYIHLGTKAENVIHWLVWAEQNNEIIASGELNSAADLTQLTEKAKTRQVVTFVSSADVALKQLTVPGNSQRAIRAAAPYMLEDELAQDVEQLFFAYANLKNVASDFNCFVAAVERRQLEQWQAWLSDANINCKVMIPDLLALPESNDGWTAVQLGKQLLIRQSAWQGMVVDLSIWPQLAKSLADHVSKQTGDEDQTLPIINHYSALTSEHFSLNALPEELPLAILAAQTPTQKFNLLQSEYQVKQSKSPIAVTWLSAASLAAVALLFTIGLKGAKISQLSAQQTKVENEIVSIYKKTFPQSKRVKVSTVRSQLKRKLSEFGAGTNQAGFLSMFEKIRPAFVIVPQLKPDSIKFDSKRQEFRIQATASGYQYFEKFKNELEKAKLTVNQGSLNNQGEQVSGSFSIKG